MDWIKNNACAILAVIPPCNTSVIAPIIKLIWHVTSVNGKMKRRERSKKSNIIIFLMLLNRDGDWEPESDSEHRPVKLCKRETGQPLLCRLYDRRFEMPNWKKMFKTRVRVRFFVCDGKVYLPLRDLCSLFGKGAGTVTRMQDQLQIGPQHRQLVRRRSDDPSQPLVRFFIGLHHCLFMQ